MNDLRTFLVPVLEAIHINIPGMKNVLDFPWSVIDAYVCNV
jgi:hypothetical protein